MTSAGVRKLCVAAALVLVASGGALARAEPRPEAAPAPLPLDITADTECPAPAAIDHALAEILGLSATAQLLEVARLAHRDARLVVTLQEPDGRLLGERALPLDGTCDELSRAAAVVLATWLSDAHPEFIPRLAQRANAEVSSANAAGNGANGVNGGRPDAAVTPAKGSVHSGGVVRPQDAWRLRAGVAVGASVLPTPIAPAGTVSVAFVPEHDGIGATLRASAVGSRERDVPGGKVRYFRQPLAAGAVVRFESANLALELDGGGALGWLHVAGRSFSPNRSADDVTFGPFAAARLLWPRARAQAFLELAGLFWLRSSRVYADVTHPSVALPQGEVTLSAGAVFAP